MGEGGLGGGGGGWSPPKLVLSSPHKVFVTELVYSVNKAWVSSLASGGFTGGWSPPKLALSHPLVLCLDDTKFH